MCDVYNSSSDTVVDSIRGRFLALKNARVAGDPLNLVIDVDNALYIVNLANYQDPDPSHDAINDPESYTHLPAMILAGMPSCINCSVDIVAYRLRFYLELNHAFSKIGFKLAGSTQSIANFMGLSEDVYVISPISMTSAYITMPNVFYRVNPRSIGRCLYYFNGFSTTGDYFTTFLAPNDVDNLTTMTLTYTDGNYLPNSDIKIKIDTRKHILAYLLNLTDGTYGGGYASRDIEFKAPSSFSPPLFYMYNRQGITNSFIIYAFYTGTDPKSGDPIATNTQLTISFNITPGQYTHQNLLDQFNACVGSNPNFAGTNVSMDASGKTVMTIQCAFQCSRFYSDAYFAYGYRNILQYLGFESNFDVSGVDMTSLTIVATNGYKEHPTNLRIQSNTLGKLRSAEYKQDDDPVYMLSNVIHKVQVLAQPGSYITDNQKYLTKQIASKFKDPITSIDISLYDEDGQVVDLNGLDWSITIRINL